MQFLKIFISSLLLSLCLSVFAQETSSEITKSPLQTIQPWQVNLSASPSLEWYANLRNSKKVHEPGLNTEKDKFLAEKNRANAARKQAIDDGTFFQHTTVSRAAGPAPTYITGFEAEHISGGGFPNDNDIAAQPNGVIISTTNHAIRIFDGNGRVLLSRSLRAFSSGISTRSNFKFDPRVMYDKANDRFVLIYISGATPSSSEVIVAFSASSDPTQLWNVYAIPGNTKPRGINTWTDYVSMGLSNEELFITGNPFSGGSNRGATLWQIPLAAGYAGNALTVQNYNLAGTFSLAPAHQPEVNPAEDFYLIAESQGAIFKIYVMDKPLSKGGTLSPATSLSGRASLSSPVDISFKGSNILLSGGDGRPFAYRVGKHVHFVVGGRKNNRAAIHYGELTIFPLGLNFSRFVTQNIGSDSLDYAYPSIAYAGVQDASGKPGSFIAFNFAGEKNFPGTGVIYIDPQGVISEHLLCKESVGGPQRANNGVNYRWGDYTGIASSGAGEAWLTGYYFFNGNDDATWLSNVLTTPTATGMGKAKMEYKMKAYPVPAIDMIYFDFEIPKAGDYTVSILGMNGQVAYRIIQNHLVRGFGHAVFNTYMLSNGAYEVVIDGPAGVSLNKKITVLH